MKVVERANHKAYEN